MTQLPPDHAIAVDIGGTFTDVVCREPDGGLRIVKVPTTRDDPSVGVRLAIDLATTEWGVAAQAIGRFVHGTTVATNAILERKHARIGIITTAGFKDVLELGRQKRRAMYDLALEPETPVFLAPGERRKEVAERVAASGEVVTPLDEAALGTAVDDLVAQGVESVAVCFLFSFVDPVHERRARELIAERHPELMVSLSCEVDPAAREYERTCVTAFDAAVKPVLDRYLSAMERDLDAAGIAAPLQIMASRGGVCSSAIARQRPVRLLLSGPAAGVTGARMVGASTGDRELITLDMGGTSCDIALVTEGRPLVRAEGTVGGYDIRVPMVDVNAIGAGGGSIAWLDAAQGLRVGPQSAGSEPGPACYGRGGEAPTVTDASVVLGYINPRTFAGGTLPLEPELARRAIAERLAGALGLGVEEAALGIHRIVNAQMAEGIRLVSIRRGFDPRALALVAGGGGGPLHACALAGDLAIERIIVPPYPGVVSACGLLAAAVEQELSAAFGRPLAELEAAELRAAYDALDARCAELMAGEAVAPETIEVHHFADACYLGQGHTLEIPIALDDGDVVQRIHRDFVGAHARVYGHSTENPVRLVNLRTVHRAGGDGWAASGPEEPCAARAPTNRAILLPEPWGEVEAAIHQRRELPVGTGVAGPAIIEQDDSTVLIEPGWRGEAVPGGALVLDREA